jgi:hypothetical protein
MVATAERFDVSNLDMEDLDSGTWTIFEDAFADGKIKFKNFELIIVQASQEEAIPLFMKITNVDPKKVTCKCCGQHFSIREYDSVFQATGFLRGCKFDKKLGSYVEEEDDFSITRLTSMEEFLEKEEVLIIFADGTMSKNIQ